MKQIFKLPDVGEGMAEGEIASWLVKEGDQVNINQPILELQNDKLLQEIISPYEGIVTKLYVEAGTIASVGDPLIEISNDNEASTTETIIEEVKEVVTPIQEVTTPNDNVLALPSVRAYAYKNNIDLSKVKGSGKYNNIIMKDLTSTQPIQEESKEIKQEEVIKEVKGNVEKASPNRIAIAKAMIKSKTKLAHVTIFDEVEVSQLIKHRASFKEVALSKEIKLSYLPYIIKSLSLLLKKYPVLNSSYDDITNDITYHQDYNVGIAVDANNGLIVPNIKAVNTKGIFTLAKELNELVIKANENKLSSSETKNGRITITNLGSLKGGFFTPIINYPEVAILGVGLINKQPIVNEDDEIVVGNIMKLSFSFDHQVIDGALAQRILNDLKELISNPDYLLMEVL